MWFSGRSASSALRGGKGLLKVGDEILDVFNADGDTDEIRRNAEFLLQFRRIGLMRHGGRNADQAFNAPETHGKLEELQGLHKLFKVIGLFIEAEREHAARAFGLAAVDGITWIGFKTRIKDGFNPGMSGKVARNRMGIFFVAGQAQRQRFDAALEQEAVERIEDAAQGLRVELELFIELVVIEDDETGEKVGMTAVIFSG